MVIDQTNVQIALLIQNAIIERGRQWRQGMQRRSLHARTNEAKGSSETLDEARGVDGRPGHRLSRRTSSSLAEDKPSDELRPERPEPFVAAPARSAPSGQNAPNR